MKTKFILRFLLSFLTIGCTMAFLQLWDVWKRLLQGEPVVGAAALASMDFRSIAVIGIPVAMMLVRREKREKPAAAQD
ncbi:hypothetical protein [Pontibacter actiniarum]|uniref:Uncharacterized protein n=1 Tax=Pontibacter actiniarum TaxID=323450 RepID=A0A1X9YRZ5_9BACT|nr:hypothetical protein [Pontibacter actiniarum]ARS35639.1 hypothetical protein CA264_09405 [Pontibacter actiniarum]